MRFLDRIRNRTALYFCLASLVPLAVLSALMCGRVYDTVHDAADRLDRTIVASLQSSIDDHLGFSREQCQTMTYSTAMQSMDRARQMPLLEEFVNTSSLFFKAMTFDRSRKLRSVAWRSRYRGEEKLIGTESLAGDAHLSRALARALEGGEAAWAEPTIDEFSQPVLYLFVPIRHFVHEERVLGAVAAAILLSGHQIQGLLDRVTLPADAFACIADDSGQMLAQRGRGLPAGSDVFPGSIDVDGVTGPLFPLRAPMVSGCSTIEGRVMLSTAARLASIGLNLVVGRPLATVQAPARQAATQVLVLSLLGLAFAVALAVILSGSFVAPLLDLAEGIRRVGEGHLAHRVPVGRRDELGVAATAFNEMAAQFEKQHLIEEIWTETWPKTAG